MEDTNERAMGWKSLGRPGLLGRSRGRQRQRFDARFGAGNWRIRHVVAQRGVDLCTIADLVEATYECFLRAHAKVLAELTSQARDIYENATSNTRSGLDYAVQERRDLHVYDIALRRVLKRLGREFSGERLIRIAGRDCDVPDLEPGKLPFHRPELIVQPALVGWWQPDSLECFWRSSKILEVKSVVGG